MRVLLCFTRWLNSPVHGKPKTKQKLLEPARTISKILFFIAVGLYAGLCLPLFSLNLAHTNDFVPKEKFVAAGGGLQFIFGIGAISGPIICSLFMSWFDINGLLSLIHI